MNPLPPPSTFIPDGTYAWQISTNGYIGPATITATVEHNVITSWVTSSGDQEYVMDTSTAMLCEFQSVFHGLLAREIDLRFRLTHLLKPMQFNAAPVMRVAAI